MEDLSLGFLRVRVADGPELVALLPLASAREALPIEDWEGSDPLRHEGLVT